MLMWGCEGLRFGEGVEELGIDFFFDGDVCN